MTTPEFTATSISLLRSALGWQSAIARRLGVESRTVRRWIAEDATPPWVDARLAELMGARGADERGHDVQLDDDDGSWIVHPRINGHREPADEVEEE